jgi:hypothetical protein
LTVGDRLQLRAGMTLAVVGAPEDAPTVDAPSAPGETADAFLVYVRNSDELEARLSELLAAAERGALAWLAYPKGGRLGTDLNRDLLRSTLMTRGVEPVRQVALDETWSALRFKRSLSA